ncbi:phage infection protein [Pseudomonas sp. AF32]|uniref:phage infection protein n=1 Tax=Pseudomonas sp. AF32 TaxID=554390 RepID=UPI001EED5BA7|nr:phage infection protein [Pseudomonas sp. AF32]MCG6575924.1 phage infection protein [Pseudomonas sp. AF32]
MFSFSKMSSLAIAMTLVGGVSLANAASAPAASPSTHGQAAQQLAEGGSDHLLERRVAEGGSDRLQQNRVAEGGADRLNELRERSAATVA